MAGGLAYAAAVIHGRIGGRRPSPAANGGGERPFCAGQNRYGADLQYRGLSEALVVEAESPYPEATSDNAGDHCFKFSYTCANTR